MVTLKSCASYIKGFKFVIPYEHTYSVFCKGRWVGKPLLPTYCKEFNAPPKLCVSK